MEVASPMSDKKTIPQGSDAREWARILFDEARRAGVERPVYEVRVVDAGRDGTVSGYFDAPAGLADAALSYSGRAPAVYTTINPVDPRLLARAANRMQTHAKATTGDRDIARRLWLPVDLDAVRPAGISSTDGEHDAA